MRWAASDGLLSLRILFLSDSEILKIVALSLHLDQPGQSSGRGAEEQPRFRHARSRSQDFHS